MPDILDQIIDLLPPSTLDLILQYDTNGSEEACDFDEVINEMQSLTLSQMTHDLNKQYLSFNSKVVENSNLLAKLSNELNARESACESADCDQGKEALRKKLINYDAQIKEIAHKLGNTDCHQLFNDIENLSKEIKELKSNIEHIKKQYEWFEGIPPDIEEAKKAIEEIKNQIKSNEEKIEAFFRSPSE